MRKKRKLVPKNQLDRRKAATLSLTHVSLRRLACGIRTVDLRRRNHGGDKQQPIPATVDRSVRFSRMQLCELHGPVELDVDVL